MEKKNKIRYLLTVLLCMTLINAHIVSAAVHTGAAGQVSSAAAEDPAGDSSKSRAVDGRGIWEKIKERLPEIDFAEFDAAAEKEKLREAVRTMDELGISPEMLVRNAWDFLSRKENRKKIDQAVDDLRDKVEEVTGGDPAGD
jgi:coenzyme F420-reducing hydrogenase delta subunit